LKKETAQSLSKGWPNSLTELAEAFKSIRGEGKNTRRCLPEENEENEHERQMLALRDVSDYGRIRGMLQPVSCLSPTNVKEGVAVLFRPEEEPLTSSRQGSERNFGRGPSCKAQPGIEKEQGRGRKRAGPFNPGFEERNGSARVET